MPFSHTYEAVAYRQAPSIDAPWILSFVARANEIVEWCGIPRRSEGDVGFQRIADEKRVALAKGFFDHVGPDGRGLNQSPTSILLGIHPGMAHQVHLEFLEPQSSDDVRKCLLHVTVDSTEPIESAVGRLRAMLESRLESPDRTSLADDEDSDHEENAGEDEEDEEDDSDDAVELGRSQVLALLGKLGDDQWVAQHEPDVRSLAMPATVIDGQHRLLGADACERGIPFTICALYDCPWEEQILQFTVINYTQKGIPDQFITANAALSLTESELDVLKPRLVQAQIKVLEYELMQVFHFSTDSPFHELINLTERRQEGMIGYKTMVRVAKEWYQGKQYALREGILPRLFPEIAGKGKVTRRRVRWQDTGIWGEFALAFWVAVHDNYAGKPSHIGGHDLWTVGHSQLMVAVVLQELQLQFFKDLNAQDEDFWETAGETPEERKDRLLAKVKKRAAKFLQSMPSEFFAKRWGTRSLNTGAGRVALQTVLGELRESKGTYKYANSALVTGKTS